MDSHWNSSGGVISLASTTTAIASLHSGGNISVWGHYGDGDARHVRNAILIAATDKAFAAICANDTASYIEAWGDSESGGQLTVDISDPVMLYSNPSAFVATHDNGTLSAWGIANSGGVLPSNLIDLDLGVLAVASTERAFAAITRGGCVVAWGDDDYGGNLPTALGLDFSSSSSSPSCVGVDVDIQALVATRTAFAALASNGSVYSWGTLDLAATGGSGQWMAPGHLVNATQVVSSGTAFLALHIDGSVTVWGDAVLATAIPDDHSLLRVIKIYAAENAFAVLTNNHTVVSWGTEAYINTKVSFSGANITTIVANTRAFAALLTNGTVVAWGDTESGGYPDLPITGAATLYSLPNAFSAVHFNGSVTAWGNAEIGGSIPGSQEDGMALSDAQVVFGNTLYHASGGNERQLHDCPYGTVVYDFTGLNVSTPPDISMYCAPCDPGTYRDGATAMTVFHDWQTCAECGMGTSSDSEGTIECTPCPPGQATGGEKGLSVCIPCPQYYYASEPGTSECTKCSAHEYTSGTGAEICTPSSCAYGTLYSRGDGCSECLHDAWCPDGLTCRDGHHGDGCAHCDDGFVLRDNTCAECPSMLLPWLPALCLGVGTALSVLSLCHFLAKPDTDMWALMWLIISHFQTVDLILHLNHMVYPEYTRSWLRWPQAVLSIHYLELVYIPECQEWNAVASWLFYALPAILLAVICAIPWRMTPCMLLGYIIDPGVAQRSAHLVLQLWYMLGISAAWQPWDCQFDSTQWKYVVEKIPYMTCFDDDGAWLGLSITSMVLVLMWTGYPYFLFKAIQGLNRRSDEAIETRGYMFHHFHDFKWWWVPAVELPKKWLLVGLSTFMPSAELQVSMVGAVLVLAWGIHAVHLPYRTDWVAIPHLENNLQHVSYALQLVLLAAVYTGSITAYQETDDIALQRDGGSLRHPHSSTYTISSIYVASLTMVCFFLGLLLLRRRRITREHRLDQLRIQQGEKVNKFDHIRLTVVDV